MPLYGQFDLELNRDLRGRGSAAFPQVHPDGTVFWVSPVVPAVYDQARQLYLPYALAIQPVPPPSLLYGDDGTAPQRVKMDPATRALVVATVGDVLAKVTGSFDTLRNMIGATKTATSVASEVFAGASRLAGRRCVIVKNEHPYLRIRVGGGAVTHKTGVALEPFWVAIFTLDPAVDVPIYVISEAGMAPYGVVEF